MIQSLDPPYKWRGCDANLTEIFFATFWAVFLKNSFTFCHLDPDLRSNVKDPDMILSTGCWVMPPKNIFEYD